VPGDLFEQIDAGNGEGEVGMEAGMEAGIPTSSARDHFCNPRLRSLNKCN
jgi:hypothetical protein